MRYLSLAGFVLLMVIVGPGVVGSANEASVLPAVKPPMTGRSAPQDAAVVIGIQDYDKLAKVPYAARDALLFHKLLMDTVGVPRRRISNLHSSAPHKEKMEREIEKRAGEVGPGGTLWVYFAGHGLPVGTDDAVLLGVDARGGLEDLAVRGVKRSWLVDVTSRSRAERVVVVLDACFSGRARGGDEVLPGTRFAVPASIEAVERVAVWSATSAEEIAGPCEAVQHGLFTYFVVGALSGWGDNDGDSRVTLGEAAGYVSEGMSAALAAGGRSQTPVLTVDPALEGWKVTRTKRGSASPNLDELSLGHHCSPRGRGGSSTTLVAPPPLTHGGGPSIESGSATAAVADVAIVAEPKKLVRLEVTPPKGKKVVSGSPYKNRAGEPGTWKVKAQAAGYEPYEATFHAPVDDVTVHRIKLKELGGLEVSGTPKGATVKVTGPGRFSHTGALTWKASGLKSGTYRVKVSRKGYQDQEKTVQVKPGRKTRLPVELQKIIEAFTGGGGPASKGVAGLEWVYSKYAKVSFARSETTVAQYRACVEAGKCDAKHHKSKSDNKYCNLGYGDRDDHPMNCVSWYGADEFCRWAGGRLPTEQEWEAEAGAGGSREYPWGGENPSCTRCIMDDNSTKGSAGSETDGCGEDHTWPVCSKRRGDSVSGLCDMAGNVWEWTSSWYDSDKKSRVLRGGSWHDVGIRRFRASDRRGRPPADRSGSPGFRCVVSSQ